MDAPVQLCSAMTYNDAGMNIVEQLSRREITPRSHARFPERNYINGGMLERLNFETELRGHTGCVNCLDWSEEGELLVSGSDDADAIVWDPFTHKELDRINTSHSDNIFAVKFFPHKNNAVVATGAGDFQVFVYDRVQGKRVAAYSCRNRVKRIVASPRVAHLMWSASEDGVVREFDIRQPARTSVRKLIDLNLLARTSTGVCCKTLAINPVHPHLLAVGANDPFVRLYDRRMIPSASSARHAKGSKRGGDDDEGRDASGCLSYFTPGHIYIKDHHHQQVRLLTTTNVAFAPDGRHLLANIGAEHVYLFDINSPQQTIFHKPSTTTTAGDNPKCPTPAARHHQKSHTGGYLSSIGRCPLLPLHVTERRDRTLPRRAEELKERANKLFGEHSYIQSIYAYSAAINLAPYSSVLYGNRAAAYLKRKWDGDVYAALRDCHSALTLNPDHAKAHFRMAKCLFELERTKEAQACLSEFKSSHPTFSKSSACAELVKEMKAWERNPQRGLPPPDHHSKVLTERESSSRQLAFDYRQRFVGSCNTLTDIKEANFLGGDGQYVVAGSDDGSFFVWERDTGNLVRVMKGDSSIVNCIQPHPYVCLLATSGIDAGVKLWSPRPADGTDERVVADVDDQATANQRRMTRDPFEALLHSVGVSVSERMNPAVNSDAVPTCATS